ncbi:MAG TPA: hypothetical protein VEO74_02700, partial [Thermoanaerobaculia bacterium]|nr:hypothetical protein [Thermoanaerobaculia bacterium]
MIFVGFADRLHGHASGIELESVIDDGTADDVADERRGFVRLEIATAEEIEIARRSVSIGPERQSRGAFENEAAAMRRNGTPRQKSAAIASRYGRMTAATRQTRAKRQSSSIVNRFCRQPSRIAAMATSMPTLLRNLKQSATVFAGEKTRS